jgi:DNA sulfur modification protein DndD
MSIYLALLKTSHKDIPFFIDTPFARIDSNHRKNIVEEFFIKIKNQMFILSTDEEIVNGYKDMLNDRISNTFMLQINNYGTTKILPERYFGD